MEQKYNCDICSKEFEKLTSLVRHNSRKHQTTPAQTILKVVHNNIPKLCLCGCGKETWFDKGHSRFVDWVEGHHARVHNNFVVSGGVEKSIKIRKKKASLGLYKGIDTPERTEQRRNIMLGSNNPRFGKKWSEQHKKIQGNKRKELYIKNPELKENISRGKLLSNGWKELEIQNLKTIQYDLELNQGTSTIVYLFHELNTNNYKIGFTKNHPIKRLTNVQTSSPNHVTIKDYFITPIGRKLEHAMHLKFKEKRIRGEWFNLTEEDVNNFKQTCKNLEEILND